MCASQKSLQTSKYHQARVPICTQQVLPKTYEGNLSYSTDDDSSSAGNL